MTANAIEKRGWENMKATQKVAKDWAIHASKQVVACTSELVLEGFKGPGTRQFGKNPLWEAVQKTGSALWLDTGDREAAGKLWSSELSGLTTNNTLVNQVVQTGALDDLVKRAAKRLRDTISGISQEQLVIEVGFVLNAHVALDLVQTFGCVVSVELHPMLANDIEGTLVFARRYHAISRSHFLVKVPLTPDGYLAARRLSAEMIPVNYTLGFSARQDYLAALFSRPRYVNVFLGRLNAVVADNGLGDGKYVGERATMASQRGVRRARERFRDLPTRQLAASMRSGQQVADLAGVDALTMPPKAAEEFLKLNIPPHQIRSQVDTEYRVTLHGGKSTAEAGLDVLWDITTEFESFVDKLLQAKTDDWDGARLIEFARESGAPDLFHAWAPEEVAEIRAHGKIPDLARWQGKVALDDLMTMCGLQSFAADQTALDQRIASLI
jgi:transaldolase